MKAAETTGLKGDKLAGYFGKKYGEFVYSGTLALEAVLVALEIKTGDYVIVPDNVCYRVLFSVIRLGAIPVIVKPRNKVVLTVADIADTLRKYPIRAILLVHSLGIPCEIKSFKQAVGDNIALIEDAAQAWDITYSGWPIGTHSDFVITSFGITKPLSFGVGGGLFADTDLFKKYLDYNNKASRQNPDAVLPYVLPEAVNIDVPKLTALANVNVRVARWTAAVLTDALSGLEINTWHLGKNDQASWHRFPVFVASKSLFQQMVAAADERHVHYELPHKLSLSEIPLALRYNSLVVNNQVDPNYQFNLFTHNNPTANINLWTKDLKNLRK